MQTTEIRRLQDSLKTPAERRQTNMCDRHYHILMNSPKSHYYDKHFSEKYVCYICMYINMYVDIA